MTIDDDPEDVRLAFQIIVFAGNARTEAYRGLQFARENDFLMAGEQLKKADRELTLGHKVQTELLSREPTGDRVNPSMLLVHALDHLATSMAERNLIEELIALHLKISGLPPARHERDRE